MVWKIRFTQIKCRDLHDLGQMLDPMDPAVRFSFPESLFCCTERKPDAGINVDFEDSLEIIVPQLSTCTVEVLNLNSAGGIKNTAGASTFDASELLSKKEFSLILNVKNRQQGTITFFATLEDIDSVNNLEQEKQQGVAKNNSGPLFTPEELKLWQENARPKIPSPLPVVVAENLCFWRLALTSSRSLKKYVQLIEEKCPVDVEFLLAGLLFILILFVFFGVLAHPIVHLLAFCYPMYASIKAIGTENEADDTLWLAYWVVYGTFAVLEHFLDFLLFWIPFYHFLKLSFLTYCMSSTTQGSLVVYNRAIRPLFMKAMKQAQRVWD